MTTIYSYSDNHGVYMRVNKEADLERIQKGGSYKIRKVSEESFKKRFFPEAKSALGGTIYKNKGVEVLQYDINEGLQARVRKKGSTVTVYHPKDNPCRLKVEQAALAEMIQVEPTKVKYVAISEKKWEKLQGTEVEPDKIQTPPAEITRQDRNLSKLLAASKKPAAKKPSIENESVTFKYRASSPSYTAKSPSLIAAFFEMIKKALWGNKSSNPPATISGGRDLKARLNALKAEYRRIERGEYVAPRPTHLVLPVEVDLPYNINIQEVRTQFVNPLED